MQVILLQNIKNLGKKYEIKNVADGYARNFLLPKKMAKPATAIALKELKKMKEIETKKEKEVLEQEQKQAEAIDGLELQIISKASEDKKLFGSITSKKISEALENKGYHIKKEQIELKEPIKETGEYDVLIKFDHGLEAAIKLIVESEKNSDE